MPPRAAWARDRGASQLMRQGLRQHPGGTETAVTAVGAGAPAAPPRPPVSGARGPGMAARVGRCGSGEVAGRGRAGGQLSDLGRRSTQFPFPELRC